MPRYFHVRLHLLCQTFVSGQLLHVRVDLPSLNRSKSFAKVVSVYWHLPMELIIQPTWHYSSRKAIWLTGSRPKWHLAVSPRCCCWEDIPDASVVTSYIKTCPVETSERSDHRVQLFKCDSYAQKWPQKKKKQVFRFQISTQCSSKTPAVYQKVTVGALTYCRDNQSQLIDNPGNNNNSNSSSNALRVTVSWQQSEWIFLTTDNGSERI